MDRTERRRRHAAWKSLSKDDRAAVMILAKQHRAHEDPIVREVSREWAESLLAPTRIAFVGPRETVLAGLVLVALSFVSRDDRLASAVAGYGGLVIVLVSVFWAQQRKAAQAVLDAIGY